MLTTDELDLRFDAVGVGHVASPEIHIDAGHASSVAVPDAHLLFSGEYHRVGSDLQISDADLRLTIHDYFRAERRPSLVAPNGATLADDVVAALATSDVGERYAQVGAGAASAQIGRVETMTGSASAVRNGVSVELHPGDPVLKGDAVQTGTGSSLGISFIDGTIFSLSASARMVLNDMVYQAGGTGNSAALTLVQGSIGFLAGQVAKTGNMQVGTPVATMGIRGTLVFTENPPAPTGNTITSVDGVVSFSIGRESDGRVGTYQVTPLSGPSLTVNDPSKIVYLTPGGSFSEDAKPPNVLQAEIGLAQLIYQIAALAQANPLQPGVGVPNGPQGGGGPGSSTPPDISGGSSPTPGGPGDGGPVNPGGHDILAPNFGQDGGSPQTTTQSSPPLAQLNPAPVVQTTPTPVSESPSTGGTSDTATSAPTPHTPPPLASQTVPLGQNQGVAVTSQRAGLLYSGGADDTTVKTEHVSFVEPGTQDNANHTAVDQGQSGTTISGTYGTLDIHADGTYSYVPLHATALAEGEIGLDQFTYSVTNESGQSSIATLTFQITGVNDAPTPTDDSASAAGHNAVSAATRSAGLLGNDTDPDHGETATLHITEVSAVTGSGTTTEAVDTTGTTTIHGLYGLLTLAADGTYSYTQDSTSSLGAGQTGTENFTFTVDDGHGAADNGTANATFTITVTGAGPFLDLDTTDGSTATGFSTNYTGSSTLVTSSNVAILDPDSTTIVSATIHLTQGDNVDTTDTLSIDSGTLATDHLLFSGSSGTYTLTTQPGFSAAEANYADALEHLTFTAAETLSARDVDVAITSYDGTTNGNTAVSAIHIAATVVSSDNLVVNGGFETGDFTGWTLSGNSGFISVNSDAHSGSYAASFGAIGSDTSLDQHLATVAGQHYLLTFWLANDGGTPNDFSALFNGSTVYAMTNGPSQGYTEYNFDVVATSSITDLDFLFRQDPAFWHFDDISVVAETSTSTTTSSATTEDLLASSGSTAVADHVVTSATGSLSIPASALLFNDTTASPDTSLSVHDVSNPATDSGTFVVVATDTGSSSTHTFNYDDIGDQSDAVTNSAQVAVQSGSVVTTENGADTIFLITSADSGTFVGGDGHDVFVFSAPSSSATYTPANIANAVVGQDAVDISFLVQSGQFNVNDSGSFLHLTHLSTEPAGTYDLYLDKVGGGTTTVAHLSGLTVDTSGDPSVTVIWDHHAVAVHASSEVLA